MEEVIACIVNLDELMFSVTAAERELCDDLVCVSHLRLECFKRHTLRNVSQLVNHWTLAAFEDNAVSISELAVL